MTNKRVYAGEWGNITGICAGLVGDPAYIYTDTGRVITTSPVVKVFRTFGNGYVFVETQHTIYECGKLLEEDIQKPYKFFVKALAPVEVGKRALVMDQYGWQLWTSPVERISGEHFETKNSIYQLDRQRCYYPAS